MNIQCVADERALHGESPVWSFEENAVYWVDIFGKSLCRTKLDSKDTQIWEMPSYPGMVSLRKKGGVIIALQDGIYGFDPQSGELEKLVQLEEDVLRNRANDGKCDVSGRLWIGTMNTENESKPTGNFYRIDPDLSVVKIASNFCIPNGLAWNPANTVMYHTDTANNVVHSFEFNAKIGLCGERKKYYEFDRKNTGGVDGAAVDERGGYWAALYGGSSLIRVSENGELDTVIPLPVSQPTMPVFGGREMKTIFLTSSRKGLSNKELQAQPLAGTLLSIPVDVRGHQVYSFGG